MKTYIYNIITYQNTQKENMVFVWVSSKILVHEKILVLVEIFLYVFAFRINL